MLFFFWRWQCGLNLPKIIGTFLAVIVNTIIATLKNGIGVLNDDIPVSTPLVIGCVISGAVIGPIIRITIALRRRAKG